MRLLQCNVMYGFVWCHVLNAQDTVIEYFDGGSSYAVKDMLTVKNQRRVINFYHT